MTPPVLPVRPPARGPRGPWPARAGRAVLLLCLLAAPMPGRAAAAGEPAAADRRGEADRLYGEVKLAEAAEIYGELVEASPGDPALRIRLADCLTRTDRFVEAIEQAERALSLGGRGAAALAALAKAEFRAGDFDAAREHLREGLEKDADCAECLWALARIQAIHGDYAGAGEGFRRAAALDPDNPVFLRYLATYVADRDRQKELYRGYLELPRREEEIVWENARAWLAMLEFAGDRPLRRAEIPDDGTEVKVELQGGMSYVPVQLGTKRRLRYLFDTGASGFTISGRMMKKLDLEPVDAFTITGIGGEGTTETRMVLVPEVRVGEAVVRNVPAVVNDSVPLVDGLLSPTLFGGAPVTLDQRRRRLWIGGPPDPAALAGEGEGNKKRPAPEPLGIPFLSINGMPFIPVEVNGRAMHALVDTGGSQAVVSPHAAEQVPELEFMAPGLTPPAYQEIRGATGGWSDVRVARRARLAYAGRELEMVSHIPDRERILVSYDLTPLSHGLGTEVWAILGNPQLDDFVLTIDWAEQVLRLLPR